VPVGWVVNPVNLLICVAVAVLVFFTAHLLRSRYVWLIWLDAVGLALVAILGAEKAMHHGPVVAVTMGVITATFGGIVRDVLGGESPVILRREVYVTAALTGAAVFVGLNGAGLPRDPAAVAGILTAFTIRGLAIHYRWSLPAYRQRPGRKPEDLGM
jgi:uncharacterized membrane protein YeiH